VPDAGGDGGGQARADNGIERHLCACVQQHRSQPDAEPSQAPPSNPDVHSDDIDVCHYSGFIFEGLPAGNEREAWALCAVDYRELYYHLPGRSLRQQEQPCRKYYRCNRDGSGLHNDTVRSGKHP